MSAAHETTSPAASPFTAQQIEEFHKEDRRAGAMVVLEMTAIFCVGVCLYTAVAYFVGIAP